MPRIELKRITKTYPHQHSPALDALSLTVQSNELLVLLGESGCGKTTTLKLINRLIEPTAGTVHINGQNVTLREPHQLRRSIGYVFQGIGLFPHRTVAENIATVPKLLGWEKRAIAQRVDELLNLMNLPPATYRHRNPAALSGGQQQRIGVARALAARPRIMLMDEPFGALDPLTRDNLQREYARLHRTLDLTTVLVTHDMTEALLLADRIAVLHAGQLLQVATPAQLIASPAHPRVRQLIATPKRQADQLEKLAGQGEGQ